MTTTPPSNIATYIYCIARSEPFSAGAPAFRAQSIGGPAYPVYTLHFMNLAAVVSDSPVSRYDVSRQNTLAHQRVIEEAMSRSEILPVRFGTIARSARAVEEQLLKRQFAEFNRLLQYVHGRAELGLKAFWNRERLFAEIVSESAQLRALRDAIAGKPEEEMHYQRIQLGQLTEEALIRKRDQDAEAIVGALRPLAVETKVNKILTDMMVLNAAFLVDEAQGPAFDARVNQLDDEQSGRLIFKYVGPLPPYNFVNVTVRWNEE